MTCQHISVGSKKSAVGIRGIIVGRLLASRGLRPDGGVGFNNEHFDDDDMLVIRLSDKPIVCEVSQDWNRPVSYAADGSVVETVILEAAKLGAWPLSIEHREVV